jgi:hypothetical protein
LDLELLLVTSINEVVFFSLFFFFFFGPAFSHALCVPFKDLLCVVVEFEMEDKGAERRQASSRHEGEPDNNTMLLTT